jgi:N-glycosidase YbiA
MKLLETKDCKLVEHTKNDKFWADGGNGSGQNKLGILLMQLRDELRKKQQ